MWVEFCIWNALIKRLVLFGLFWVIQRRPPEQCFSQEGSDLQTPGRSVCLRCVVTIRTTQGGLNVTCGAVFMGQLELYCLLPLGDAAAPNRPSVKKRRLNYNTNLSICCRQAEICVTAVSYKLTDTLVPASVDTPVQLFVSGNI